MPEEGPWPIRSLVRPELGAGRILPLVALGVAPHPRGSGLLRLAGAGELSGD
jgi:hypothetical protein